MVFPTFFNVSLNLAIRSSWSEPQLAPGLVSADCRSQSFYIFGCKEYNQSDFSIDHLLMSMCRVFSFVIGRGCLLWPVSSLGKTFSICPASESLDKMYHINITFHLVNTDAWKQKQVLFMIKISFPNFLKEMFCENFISWNMLRERQRNKKSSHSVCLCFFFSALWNN